MGITITLSSAAMGDVSEADFDAWAAYVVAHIDEGTGLEIAEVDQGQFGDAGEDQISGATEEELTEIRSWLAVAGWEAFCADASAWPMTRERAEVIGAEDGVAEVLEVLNTQGRDVVVATLRPGHLGWDEDAINNACHSHRGVPDEHREAYYEAYEKAARAKAEEIRDEAT